MNRRIHDISQRLHGALPVWPGDANFHCRNSATAGAGSSVTLHQVSMSTQSGTHAECSLHVRSDAASLESLDLTIFIGRCELRDVSHAGPLVTASDVLDRLPARVERVLLRTFHDADWSRWPTGFKAVDPELIDALAARGCRLIGTDAPSIDPETCKVLRSHQAVHRAGMGILEGLVLDGIAEGSYELIALPLPIDAVEATPVRAVLREIG